MDYYYTKLVTRLMVSRMERRMLEKQNREAKKFLALLIIVITLLFIFKKPAELEKVEMIETVTGTIVDTSPKAESTFAPPTRVVAPKRQVFIHPTVKEALKRSAKTILTYEIANGNAADQELVIAAWTRRLIKMQAKYPKASADRLINLVSIGWNPNMDKDWAAIKKRVCKTRVRKDFEKAALQSALTGHYKTVAGKTAWKNKVTDFAHLSGKKPSYYKKLDSWVYTPQNIDVKTIVACASNPGWLV